MQVDLTYPSDDQPKQSLLELSRDELAALLAEIGEPAFRQGLSKLQRPPPRQRHHGAAAA